MFWENANNSALSYSSTTDAKDEIIATPDSSAQGLLPRSFRESKRAPREVRSDTISSFLGVPLPPSVWPRRWRVPSAMIGFWFLALVIAVAHHAVFIYLSGRIINVNHEHVPFSSTSIPQAYATTFSLALVTAFRAAMVASIGMCFTQCLWQKLRIELLEIGLIEELFQIRENALRMLKPAVIRYAPLLLSIATLSWLLPVAMIYPPGALVVGLEYREVNERFNVSVIPSGAAFDPFANGRANVSFNTGFAEVLKAYVTNDTFAYRNVQPDLLLVARTVLASSKILELGRPSGTNVSYTLQFQGPKFQCRDGFGTTDMLLPPAYLHPWHADALPEHEIIGVRVSYPMYQVYRQPDGLTMLDSTGIPDYLSIAPCPQATKPSYRDKATGREFAEGLHFSNDTTLVRAYTSRTCATVVANYDVNITFTNSIQQVSYRTTEHTPLKRMPASLEKFDYRPMHSIQEYVNLRALVDSLTVNFDLRGQTPINLEFDPAALEKPKWINSTNDEVHYRSLLGCATKPNYEVDMTGSALIGVSAFNKDRNIKSELARLKPGNLTITEDMLNEVLANITISALSLNKHYEMKNGSSTRVFNVYHFNNRLSFYLPYGLCLLFTIPVLVVGLLALQHNGVTAIDGGFVQLLMTTTGRTRIEDAAGAGCMGGEENVPKDLLKMKVRFGEMLEGNVLSRSEDMDMKHEEQERRNMEALHVDQNIGYHGDVERADVRYDAVKQNSDMKRRGIVRRAGFGLTEETMPLEKGVRYGRTQV